MAKVRQREENPSGTHMTFPLFNLQLDKQKLRFAPRGPLSSGPCLMNILLFSSPGNWGSGGGERGAGVKTRRTRRPCPVTPWDTTAAEHLFLLRIFVHCRIFFRLVIVQTTRSLYSSSTCFGSVPPPAPLCVTSKREKMACFFLLNPDSCWFSPPRLNETMNTTVLILIGTQDNVLAVCSRGSWSSWRTSAAFPRESLALESPPLFSP